MLPFQYEIVEELNGSDALCVISSGLGWVKPVSAFLRARAVAANGGTILLLGVRTHQKEALEGELRRQDSSLPLPIDINSGVSALKRLEYYTTGPYCYVTTRILVVDLLTEKISPDAFAGIIVLNAEKVSDNSGIEFVIRLYRKSNIVGFVRAFSDQPLSFLSGFKKAGEVMKALQVRSLFLWPRFQITIKSDLETTPIQVIEITQSLSPAMMEIQNAVKELMTVLVEELKKTGKIDCSEMIPENCLFKNFDEMVKKQMDSVWHTASWKTKQIVQDLRQLRELLSERIQMTGGDSIWQFHDAAHTIFEQAKRRVYVLELQNKETEKPHAGHKRKQGTQTCCQPSVRPILEPLPKWDALKEVLTEIQSEIRSATSQNGAEKKRVLVVCREMFMKNQLRWAIQDPHRLLQELFQEYLTTSRDLRESALVQHRNKRHEGPLRCDFTLYVRGDLAETLTSLNSSVTPMESLALNNAAQSLRQKRRQRKPAGIKRRQTRARKAIDEEPEDSEIEDAKPRRSTGTMLYNNDSWEAEVEVHDLLQNVYFHPLDSKNESVLWETEPDYVIMYHPDVAFVRQIEVFQAENPDKQIKLYVIYYDNSVEQTAFEQQVQREIEVFTNLIEHKGKITIPLDINRTQDLAPRLETSRVIQVAGRPKVVQQAPSAFDPNKRLRVIIDMREFMSKLPAVLHKSFKIMPVTLEIGDFVLTPDIVVERKTLPDLYSSMKSGRLFNQADAMTKRCNIPILLIEFDSVKQFRLQSDADIGKEISSQSIISRLALLVLHFPRLRLIWSPSLDDTCEIFQKLKKNRSEPELDEVVQVQNRRIASKEIANEKAVDILRKLPGVTESNCRKLMSGCSSLAGLAKTSLDRLEQIMGSKKNAKALHTFLHTQCPTL